MRPSDRSRLRPTAPSLPAAGLPAEWGAAIVLTAVLVYFSLKAQQFHSASNLRLLARQSASLAIVASAMTLVIATGGIDISVGSVLGLSAMTMGWALTRTGGNLAAACAAAMLAGSLVGLANGLLIAGARLPPILVTLATYAAARSGARLFNHGQSISYVPMSLYNLVDRTDLAGVPLLFWWGMAALLGAALLLRLTTFGRSLLALGGNRTAARLSGIRVTRTETIVYVISGASAGFAAIIDVGMNATATPEAGLFLELVAITAVVLGGTSILGGEATLLGTTLGVATVGALLSGVRLLGLEDQVAWLFVGLALIAAVEAQRMSGRLRSARLQKEGET